jgi:hypothetical protein
MQVPIFGLVDDDGDIMAPGSVPLPQGPQEAGAAPVDPQHQPAAGERVGRVLLERAGLGFTRRGNLSKHVHGSIGARPTLNFYQKTPISLREHECPLESSDTPAYPQHQPQRASKWGGHYLGAIGACRRGLHGSRQP